MKSVIDTDTRRHFLMLLDSNMIDLSYKFTPVLQSRPQGQQVATVSSQQQK